LALWAPGPLRRRPAISISEPYAGLYASACEALPVGSLIWSTGAAQLIVSRPEEVSETNWFFRLSRHQAALLAALETGALQVEPRERQREF